MASSPTEPTSPVAFALQEAAACWNQALAALTLGEIDRVDALLEIAGEHVAAAGDGAHDSPTEAALRSEARGAFARLQHGMKVGLEGLQAELARSRQGAKVLRGYGAGSAPVNRVSREG